MQTIYYKTNHYVCHTDNVVDLNEYRRKLARVEQGSCAPQVWEQEPLRAAPQSCPRKRRSSVRRRQGFMLDLFASIGVLVMTLTFTLRILAM